MKLSDIRLPNFTVAEIASLTSTGVKLGVFIGVGIQLFLYAQTDTCRKLSAINATLFEYQTVGKALVKNGAASAVLDGMIKNQEKAARELCFEVPRHASPVLCSLHRWTSRFATSRL